MSQGGNLARIDDLSKPRDFRHSFVEGGVFGLENATRVIVDRKPAAAILRILAEFLEAEGAIGAHEDIDAAPPLRDFDRPQYYVLMRH